MILFFSIFDLDVYKKSLFKVNFVVPERLQVRRGGWNRLEKELEAGLLEGIGVQRKVRRRWFTPEWD